MQNLILLFLRYGHVILFLVLESLCFYLVVQNNEYHRSIFLHSSNKVSGNLLDNLDQWKDYFNLAQINDSIVLDNKNLKEEVLYLREVIRHANIPNPELVDTSYRVLTAKVINNTIHLQNNYMTLNKGKKDGVRPRMGVVTEQGVIGIVEHVSQDFCTVLPLLNSRTRVRGRINRNQAIGSVLWDGKNIDELVMEGVPKHLSIKPGDTITTSGYSTIFPENLHLGVVKEVTLPTGSNTYLIKLKSPIRFGELNYVYIIENKLQEQQLELESNNQ